MAAHTSTGAGLASEPSAPVLSNPSMGDEPAALLVHEVQVFGDDERHRAECSCGWVSDWQIDDVAAVVAGVEHPEIAVGPADALDGFMGELLDLQDDVSELVIWLAENWSAALPVPELWGTSARHRRPLDVTVRCASRAELAQVAAVMETPVQSDRFYDSDGCSYQCARRRFGRVVFEAWRYER
jgi:hypothetical protein